MRFLIDANLSPRVAEGLRSAGYDAVHVAGFNMVTATDDEIFDRAVIDDLVCGHGGQRLREAPRAAPGIEPFGDPRSRRRRPRQVRVDLRCQPLLLRCSRARRDHHGRPTAPSTLSRSDLSPSVVSVASAVSRLGDGFPSARHRRFPPMSPSVGATRPRTRGSHPQWPRRRSARTADSIGVASHGATTLDGPRLMTCGRTSRATSPTSAACPV